MGNGTAGDVSISPVGAPTRSHQLAVKLQQAWRPLTDFCLYQKEKRHLTEDSAHAFSYLELEAFHIDAVVEAYHCREQPDGGTTRTDRGMSIAKPVAADMLCCHRSTPIPQAFHPGTAPGPG